MINFVNPDELQKAEDIINSCNKENYLINVQPEKFNENMSPEFSKAPLIKNRIFDTKVHDTAVYGFSTRLGGVSRGYFSSLNVDFKLGDEKENVLQNYRILCESLGVKEDRLSLPDQQHHTNVRVIKKDSVLNAPYDIKYQDADGQVTNVPGICLICYGADCGMLLFSDPVVKAVGACHAGWRGTADGIPAEVIKKFKRQYGSDPADIAVFDGPCAGPCCYEVDQKVRNEFKDFHNPQIFTPSENPDHYMLNLFEAQKESLINAGVRSQNIISSQICTIHNSALFFSHRVSGKKRGLNCGVIALKN